jgi:uncharacterized repeat protein (TIGR01451 family)
VSADSRLAPLSRLRSERTLTALTVVGLLGGVVSLVVAGIAPLYGVGALLYLVALSFPLVGLALGIAALAVLVASDDDTGASVPLGGVPERGVTGAGTAVGSEFSRLLDQARHRRYRGETTPRSEQLHETLTGTVVRRLRTQEGLDTASAEAVVEDGSWTADPVAAGFLSAQRRMPPLERLRGAVDPGGAYQRRLDRTLDAIDRIDERDTRTGAGSESTEMSADEGPTETVFAGELPAGNWSKRAGTWGVAVTLVLLATGIAFARPILVVGATLGLWYAAGGILASPPEGSVELTRQVSTASGDPGDVVAVEMTVHNTGDVPLVDLSVADGVPGELPVRSGSPRTGISLAPGESEQVSYDLELRRGEFEFGPVALRMADLTGIFTGRVTVGHESTQELRCVPAVERVPLGDATNDYAGSVPTDEGGSGIEFYAVREYESGDPVSSVDWRRYAHTRDLATVEFRAERATRVVCLVDCRESQQSAPTETRLPAVDISAAAAERTVGALLETGHPTGLTAVEERTLSQVEPGTGSETRVAVGELLDAKRNGHEPQTGHVRSVSRATTTLPGTLPGEAQVFLFSSLVDESPLELTTRLRSRGFSVTIISPDVTAGVERTAVRLAGLERERRLVQARASGARVVDWDPGRPLVGVLEEAMQGVTRA